MTLVDRCDLSSRARQTMTGRLGDCRLRLEPRPAGRPPLRAALISP
ncbi:hypothetical protein [Actinoplanes utahensis]|nr:hypothetical protein [Actinoplanes utahensis]